MALLTEHEIDYIISKETDEKRIGNSAVKCIRHFVTVQTVKRTEFDETPNLFFGPFLSDPDELDSSTVKSGISTMGIWSFDTT